MGRALTPMPFRSRFLPVRNGSAVLPARSWLAVLAIGLGSGLVVAALGDERVVQPVSTLAGFGAAAAIGIGIRANKPSRPLAWQLMAACLLLTTISGGMLQASGAFGLAGAVINGIGVVLGIGAFALLVRGRIPGGDRAALLDAAILASGLAVLIGAFGFAPLLGSTGSTSFAGALIYLAVIALAMIGRLWFLGGAHQPATRLIILFIVASNGVTGLDSLRNLLEPGLYAGAHVFAVVATLTLVSAAALHPAMALAPERHRADIQGMSRQRLLALVGAILVNPASLAIQVGMGGVIDPAPYVIGGVLIGLLVVARLADTLRQLHDSLRERESLTELLRRQSLYDTLTALPNRNLFNQRVAADFAERAENHPMAVILVDLDDFKSVNDQYGHETGDAVLVAVGERLQASIRTTDLAARLGGDGVVITLPTCSDALVPLQVAERVLTNLSRPYTIGGRSLTVLASVGVGVAERVDATPDEVVRKADVAMYLAKHRGSGSIEVFDPSMDSAAAEQVELRTDLAAGIAAGDLRLHYDPVVDLGTGQTVGHDAIVRWLRRGDLLDPAAFMPVAVSSGLVRLVTDWALAEACRATTLRGDHDGTPWVSVNLPAIELMAPDIATRIATVLDATGLAPHRLVLSITETSLIQVDMARPAIERVSTVGVRIAVDDFGTGYAALSYLAHLPIDIIKIDRSFVAALHRSGSDEAIASSILAVAGRLGLTTIAEGIDSVGQLDQLAALGCDFGQGEYFASTTHQGLRSRSRRLGQRTRLVGVRT